MQLQTINRPVVIKDNLFWTFICHCLNFDRTQRYSAEQALQDPYFIGPQAQYEISQDARQIAVQLQLAQQNGDSSVTLYDINPSFTVPKSEIKAAINYDPDVDLQPIYAQIPNQQIYQQQQQSIRPLQSLQQGSIPSSVQPQMNLIPPGQQQYQQQQFQQQQIQLINDPSSSQSQQYLKQSQYAVGKSTVVPSKDMSISQQSPYIPAYQPAQQILPVQSQFSTPIQQQLINNQLYQQNIIQPALPQQIQYQQQQLQQPIVNQQFPNQIQYGQQQINIQQQEQINPAMLQPNPGAGQQQQFQPPGFGQQLQHTGIYAQLPPPVVVQPPKIPPNLQPVGGVQSAQISANIQLTSQPEENDVQIPCEICKKMIRFSKYEEHLKVHQIEQEKKRIERENKRKLEDKLKQNQGKQLWGQGATFDKYQFNDMKGIQDHPEIISAQESKQDLSKTAQAVDPTLLKDALSKTAVAQQITPVIVLVDCPFCNQNLKSAEIWDHIKEHHKDKKHLYKDVSDILHFAIRDPNTGKLSINSTALIKCPYCQKTIQGDFEKHLNSSPHKQAYWVEFHNLLKHHYDLLSRLPNQFKAPEGYVFCPFCKDKHTKGKYEEHIVTNHKHKSKAQFFKLMTEIIPHMRRESTGFYVTHDMARLQCPFCNSLNNEYVEQHIWFYHKREEWAQFNQFLQSMEDSQ